MIDTNGPHDADFAAINGVRYLFLSEDGSGASSTITSQLLVFDSQTRLFEVLQLQRIPTDGAHATELFEAVGTAWLAVANFGNRLGKRYAASS